MAVDTPNKTTTAEEKGTMQVQRQFYDRKLVQIIESIPLDELRKSLGLEPQEEFKKNISSHQSNTTDFKKKEVFEKFKQLPSIHTDEDPIEMLKTMRKTRLDKISKDYE